jgi:hypothetical protein
MKNQTAITVILDRSGSMYPHVNDLIGGYNSFVKEQQESGQDITLALVTFNSDYSYKHFHKPIGEVEPLNDLYAMGGTAYYGTLCRVIDYEGKRLSELPESERPERVLIVVYTDGEDNAPLKGTNQSLCAQKVKHQQDVYNWSFLFLSQGIPIDQGVDSGIAQEACRAHDSNSDSILEGFRALSNSTSDYSSGKSYRASFI